ALLFGPAVVAVAVDRFSAMFGPKVNEATRLVLIGAFSLLTGLAVARWAGLSGDVPYALLAVATAAVIPWGFDRWKAVREWSRWLAVLSLALGATTFVQLRPLIFPLADTGANATVTNKDLSVFMVVMDEFPLYALLGPDGTINAERWPGFASLANQSTWYRDALAVSNFTHQAVPAVLASSRPVRDGGPFLYSYPHNIFTLYAEEMKVAGTEPVTSLCPKRVCGGESAFGTGVSATRLRRFMKDVSIVYGQRVLPPTLRRRLPAVDQGWGGFAAVRDKFKQQLHDQVFSQRDAVVNGAEAFAASAEPMVKVVHALLPHAPWRLTPDGRVAPLSPEIGTQNPEDEDGTRDTYQAFLHQLAATDAAVSRAMETIKASGKWDSTMFVLTADHGISFLPTLPQRNTDF
ncbi:MAG: sulfatase-like hydrolase/transferase, partial [Actinomycetota bacterium]